MSRSWKAKKKRKKKTEKLSEYKTWQLNAAWYQELDLETEKTEKMETVMAFK